MPPQATGSTASRINQMGFSSLVYSDATACVRSYIWRCTVELRGWLFYCTVRCASRLAKNTAVAWQSGEHLHGNKRQVCQVLSYSEWAGEAINKCSDEVEWELPHRSMKGRDKRRQICLLKDRWGVGPGEQINMSQVRVSSGVKTKVLQTDYITNWLEMQTGKYSTGKPGLGTRWSPGRGGDFIFLQCRLRFLCNWVAGMA